MEPEKIGKYRIIDLLGVGAMGKVYKGFDTKMGRFVAIKVMAEKYVSDEDVKKRFYKEAIAPAKLFHPNIVNIYDLDEENGKPFIVMEYLDGIDLKKIKKIGVSFSIPQAINILLQVSRGLAHAHSNGIVHRDIKPANLILLKTGTIKIVDFGIAKLFESTALTRTGMAIGTPAYMSPEQAKGKTIDIRSDQFSLGIVAYEILTGKNPFLSNNYTAIIYKILNEDPPKLTYLIPECPEELAEIVEKMLKKRIDDRFENLFEVTKRLEILIQNYTEPETRLSDLQTFFEKTKSPSTFSNQKIFQVKQLIRNSKFDSASKILSSIEKEADPRILEELKKELERSQHEKKLNEFLNQIKILEERGNYSEAIEKIKAQLEKSGPHPALEKALLRLKDKEKKFIEEKKIKPALHKSKELEEKGEFEKALELLKNVLNLDESNIDLQRNIIQLERKVARINAILKNKNYIFDLIKEGEYVLAFKNTELLIEEYKGEIQLDKTLAEIKDFFIGKFFENIEKNLREENFSKARKTLEQVISPQNREFFNKIKDLSRDFLYNTEEFFKKILNEENIYFLDFFINRGIKFFGEVETLTRIKTRIENFKKELEEEIKRGELIGDELLNRVKTIRDLIKREEFEIALSKLNEAKVKFQGVEILDELSKTLKEKIAESEKREKIENLKREYELNLETGNLKKAEDILKSLENEVNQDDYFILKSRFNKFKEKFEKKRRLRKILDSIKKLEESGDIDSAFNVARKGVEEFPDSGELRELYETLQKEIKLEEKNRKTKKLVQEIELSIKDENFISAEKKLEELKKLSPSSSDTFEIEIELKEKKKAFVDKILNLTNKNLSEGYFEEAEKLLKSAVNKCNSPIFENLEKKIDRDKKIFQDVLKIKSHLKNKKFDIALMHAEILSKNNPNSDLALNIFEKVISEREKFIKITLQRALDFESRGEYSKAIKLLRENIKFIPNSAELNEKLEKLEKKRSEKIQEEGISEAEKKILREELEEILKKAEAQRKNGNYFDSLRILENSKSRYPVFTKEIDRKISEIQEELEKRLETGTKSSKSIMVVVILFLVIAISALGYLIFKPKPPIPVIQKSTLILDFKPWAKVIEIKDLKNNREVLKGERYTPFNVEIPPGYYKIAYKFPGISKDVFKKRIKLKPGTKKILKDTHPEFEKKLNEKVDEILNKK